jgi:acyl-CoA synthetase (NDP forming)
MTSGREEKQANLARMLRPATIAFIGGSQVSGPIRATRAAGYKGEIWVVNPTKDELEGIPCFTSISDLPHPPDAAVLGLSPTRSVEAVRQLAAIGAGGAVVMSAGFKELGGEGEKLQAELVSASGDMAVLGPNCMGILNQFDSAAVWGEENHMSPVEGDGCAIISQSGAFLFGITNVEQAFPLGYAISTGNQAVTDMADCVEAVLQDERVKAIGLYLEGMDDGRALGRACWKALKRGVPVVALKGGDSPAAETVAISHTASMMVERDLWDAFRERYGIAEVSTPKALVETLKLLTVGGIPAGNRISVVSFSGGLNGLAAKFAGDLGLELPQPAPDNAARLRTLMPETVPVSNPLDLNLPFKSKVGISMENGDCVGEGIVMLSEDVSDQVVFFVDVPRPDEKGLDAAWLPILKALPQVKNSLGKPCSVAGILPEGLNLSLRQELLSGGVAPLSGFGEVMEALKVASALAEYRSKIAAEDWPADLLKLGNQGKAELLNEAQSKDLLRSFGLNTPDYGVATLAEAPDVADRLGYPVAVKVLSNRIAHKVRVNGVHLNLQNSHDVAKAVEKMVIDVPAAEGGHPVNKVLVEKMIADPVREFIIGVKRHEALGLALMIGLGGSNVEEEKTYSSLLLPICKKELDDTLRKFGLSQDSRAAQALARASHAVADFAEQYHNRLATLDVNPILLTRDGECFAADALIVLSTEGGR